MRTSRILTAVTLASLALSIAACGDSDDGDKNPLNPDTAPTASVDRFSVDAGTLMVRDEANGLPGPNEPIDFDSGAPFLTQGLGPSGETVMYYNFDVQPTHSVPIFAFFWGDGTPVADQLNVIDVIPGDEGYGDFWHVHKVTVPDGYLPNSLTNVADIMASGYAVERTNLIVNCPVVPEGSTAVLRYGGGNSGLVQGWYKDQVVYYFDFSEKILTVGLPPEGHPDVPLSEILVSFNVNPGEPGGGPASGFVTEPGTVQTHNALQTLPEDEGYSPLWDVDVYDNADFDNVHDFASASAANILAMGVATVNCPVVSVQE